MNVIASTVTRQGTRFLESFSKLVEKREAVKLYLAHKQARFIYCCGVQLPGIDSRAGATLHVCHSHLFVKLPVSVRSSIRTRVVKTRAHTKYYCVLLVDARTLLNNYART